VKREEFWLGVCVYLLIILAGHLGPEFTKIPFLNQKMADLFHLSAEGKLAPPAAFKVSLGNPVEVTGLKNPKRSGGYLPVQSSKVHSRLKAKGKGTPALSQGRAQGPVSPISFSL
jgi:hypothetical protein